MDDKTLASEHARVWTTFEEWRRLMKFDRNQCASLFGCTTRTINRLRNGERQINPVEVEGMEALYQKMLKELTERIQITE